MLVLANTSHGATDHATVIKQCTVSRAALFLSAGTPRITPQSWTPPRALEEKQRPTWGSNGIYDGPLGPLKATNLETGTVL